MRLHIVISWFKYKINRRQIWYKAKKKTTKKRQLVTELLVPALGQAHTECIQKSWKVKTVNCIKRTIKSTYNFSKTYKQSFTLQKYLISLCSCVLSWKIISVLVVKELNTERFVVDHLLQDEITRYFKRSILSCLLCSLYICKSSSNIQNRRLG